MNGGERGQWAERFRGPALAALGGTPLVGAGRVSRDQAIAFIDGFCDEMGHRRMVDPFILRWMLGCPGDDSSVRGTSPDVALWRALLDRTDPRPFILPGDGPLTSATGDVVIETATETELSALHALWHHGVQRADHSLRARALGAARWAVDNLQPDNATNHPWAAHVFVELSFIEPGGGAGLYAQTLLHNCMVARGRPDRFSAVILLDAARALDGAGNT